MKDNSEKGIPVFPIDIIPSSVKQSKFLNLLPDDFETEDDVNQLIWQIFHEAECNYLYFEKQGTSDQSQLREAASRGDILLGETEFYWYIHPASKSNRSFVHIERHSENYRLDLEKEIVDKGPMFMRTKIELSQRKKTELETWQKIQMEEEFREQIKKEKNKYDIFLSYSSTDREIAEKIFKAISKAGGKAFLAKKKIQPGADFEEEIRLALSTAQEVWLLVSPDSVKSEWVISEWGAAWVLRKKIVPILHRCPPESLPQRLQKLQCIDVHEFNELIDSTFNKKNG